MAEFEQEYIGSVAVGDSGERACPGADDPEERCPRHPSECTCWQIDTDHPMMKRAAPQPLHTTNCCKCGRIIDTREKKDGGDDFGAQLSDGRWTCLIECDDAVINPTHSQGAGTPGLLTDPAPADHVTGSNLVSGYCRDCEERTTIVAEVEHMADRAETAVIAANALQARLDEAEERLAEAELIIEERDDRMALVDRIADLIGLPKDQELDQVAFELWFSANKAPPSEHVETLYRWRGPRGGWIYDERKPTGWHSERLEVRVAAAASEGSTDA